MRRGEVRWYKFSSPDKRRPVVILTRDSALEFLGEVTVAPVTSTIRDIPSEVLLTEADGMSRPCAVNLDHIQTVSKGKIGSLITTLSSDRMSQIRQALRFALAL
ncbi:MAG: type II toxin-antitoxin system PemK/MazF family toxin [Nitrospira sp.]|nr:type II toxin-antitoxin system PemK/MazF family toxin [Nitrospira sp.]MCP9461547.1 type II toxin-antitoxin system PemK/MazF family toxin [Nitrospira sp.]MCP9476112.1 type II toxin-antitoxin system PemK/MazF family toxin [Nitrospira sp.]